MNWEKRFTNFIGSQASVVLHTIFFIVMFLLPFFGAKLDTVLLILTTLVSLEAIYLAIFIQMTVNANTESLEEVEENIDEIQENMDEIQEDVDEIQQDVDEISIDIDEIESGIEDMQTESDMEDQEDGADLDHIKALLKKLLEEVDRIKQTK